MWNPGSFIGSMVPGGGKTDWAGRFIAGGMDDLEELAICGL